MRKSLIAATIVLLVTLLAVTSVHMETGSLTGQKICLDPGHGGDSDLGAVNGAYDLEEKDINLDVAYGLKALLETDGAEVVMTRADDSSKSNSDRYGFCNNLQADILVSVHTNSVADSSVDGSLALYFHRDDKALAQAIYDVMYPYLWDTAPDPNNFTDFGLDRFASGVLLKSDMPAAMMEPLFMSHDVEADLLTVTMNLVDAQGVVVLDASGTPSPNPDCVDCRRAQIAQAIYEGILNYFSMSGDVPPSVSITNPNDGTTVSGTVMVAADASDDNGVTQVEFFVDGSSIGVDSDGSDGWFTSWNTTSVNDGPHTVAVTATDTAGQTASDSISVTVDNSGSGEGISLTATGYKVRGLQKADLEWNGATSTNIDVYRDGVPIATTVNDGFYIDDIDRRGRGSYAYQVCEEGTSTCSNEVIVSF